MRIIAVGGNVVGDSKLFEELRWDLQQMLRMTFSFTGSEEPIAQTVTHL